MKIFKILLSAILLVTVMGIMVGCKSSESTATPTQTTTVTRGDLTLDITAAGNLALSTIEDLTFDLFYAKGTVGEVMVSEGDAVTEGQVLASLDTSEWNDQIQTLEDAVTTAQRTATTKERALATAQRQVTTLTRQITAKEDAVVTAQRQVAVKELAVQQAQIDVESANNTLNKIAPIKNIQDRIDNLETVITTATSIISGEFAGGVTFIDPTYWTTLKNLALAELAKAQQDMQDILNGNSNPTSEDVAIQVAQAQLQIKMKQMALEDAQIAIENAQTAVENAQTAVTDAQQDLVYGQLDAEDAQTNLDDANRKVEEAQKALDDARAASPEIVAPFDGFVTKVNVAGGDEVLKGAIIVQVADPNKFKAAILVSEMDILSVTLGDTGTVTADAIPDVSFPVEVTHISPTATISSSVVNYSVTVQITSLIPVATTTTIQMPSGNFTLPEGFTPPTDFTIPPDFTPPADFTIPPDFTPTAGIQRPSGQGNFLQRGNTSTDVSAASSNTTATDKEYTLKAGMTVTVTLTLPLSTDVLLVPSSAILTMGSQSYVVVMLDDGTTENRIITTGNTDYTNTEVTGGLTEGEKVVVSPTTIKATATTTTNTNRNNGGIRIFEGGPPGG